MKKFNYIQFILSAAILLFNAGCGGYLTPFKTTPARLGTPTTINKELTSLPAPKEKIVAAVYKFRDQSGQYKATETGTSWSTAVTQGATSILIRALEESGWFIPIEREGLSDLLNERKIIRTSRANYSNNDETNNNNILPPLLYAGVILEGGIISYDTNILTGGAGLKYFGAGASGEYRQDQVTVYLRAISTQSGRILKTVYTTKTVLSQKVDVGFFRFVKVQRLLESEVGYSYNEPIVLCVTEAIEKAVQSLIIEGVFDKLWSLNNPADSSSAVITGYLNSKDETAENDYFGKSITTARDNFGFGITAGGQQYSGDYPNPLIKSSFGVMINVPVEDGLAINLNLGSGTLSSQRIFTAKTFFADLQLRYNFLRHSKLSPFALLGLGVINKMKSSNYYTAQNQKDNLYSLVSGIGLEYMIFGKLGLNAALTNHYLLDDSLDGLSRGRQNDYYWRAHFGFTFYFGL